MRDLIRQPDEDPKQDYVAVAYVQVQGYGRSRDAQKTVARIARQLRQAFGAENVKVDLSTIIRGIEVEEWKAPRGVDGKWIRHE